MKLGEQEILMRDDLYRLGCFAVEQGQETFLCGENSSASYGALQVQLSAKAEEEVFHIRVEITANDDFTCERLGMYLGIDTYMDTYPQWNDKLFPTAMRCEREGFWGCFISPEGVMLGMASPSAIVSWSHCYSKVCGDVGHRIYTACVDFLHMGTQPARHPKSPAKFCGGETYTYDLYWKIVTDEQALFSFVKEYAGITVPRFLKHTLEPGETPRLLDDCGEAYRQLLDTVDTNRPDNRIFLSESGVADVELYTRKDWFYYLDCARKSAEICQQKPGTHAESWYGYFSRILYAKHSGDRQYLKDLEQEFESFFFVLAKRQTYRLKKKTFIHRLQNSSCMLSLLADFYEVTGNRKYLDWADSIATWLMELQAEEGSYRSHGTHYTCVIYPAKSMLELALAEKQAGLGDRYQKHYGSAYRAIEDLLRRMDDIETEGEMTFEDGMISCEALQLGYLALQCENEEDRERFGEAARIILDKHRCLEQWLIPDGRIKGATMRYWEARYDINFDANMLNSPHGWTSWKTYATYYLYLLTGELRYLTDTMDTLGACMQCVDENGVLRWAFVPNPSVTGRRMVPADNRQGFAFVDAVVSEEYLPMVSDWYRQNPKKLRMQYIMWIKREKCNRFDRGGSCDNDVHEHFKCLEETAFGKAFLHFRDDGEPVRYNCMEDETGGYRSDDPYVKTFIVRAVQNGTVRIGGREYPIKTGINMLSIR